MPNAKPSTCDDCPVASIHQGFAYGEGPTTAPIIFIGEALGEVEANTGRPFVGGTGKMLRMMIYQAGIAPNTYYMTNTVKCRPPGNATPSKEIAAFCGGKYLHKELTLRPKPKVIVAVGDLAYRFLIPNPPVGITAARGYTFESEYGVVIPIVHPSFVARGNPHYWSITVNDLKKVKELAEGTYTGPPEEHFIIKPSIDQWLEVVEKIKRDRLRYTFDIETVGWREKLNIMCIGVAWSPNHAICVPFLTRGGHPYWPLPEHEELAWRGFMELFDSDIQRIGQNIFTFDMPVLMDLGVKFRRTTEDGNTTTHDTLIRHHIIATELPHSLEFLTSIYTNMAHFKLAVKGAGGMLWAPDEVLWTYNCRDCISTYTADYHISEEMKELKLA